MGVRGLETFASQYVRKGLINVDIIDQIKDWKKKNDDEEPLIVIDIRELFIAVTQIDVRGVYYGGRHNIFLEKLDDFFRKLIEVGAKLVFFKKGAGNSNYQENVASTLEERYQEYVEDFTAIDAGTFVLKRSNMRIRTLLSTELEAIAEKYGELHYSVDGNAAIAIYAKVHSNVLAILAKDSDFLAYKSILPIQYWSCSYDNLNFSLFRTKRFNIDGLYKCLCLETSQVTLLVAILSFYDRYEKEMKEFLRDPNGRNLEYKWDIVRPKHKQKLSNSVQRIQRIASFVWANWKIEFDFNKITHDIVRGKVNEEMVAYLQSEYNKYDVDNYEQSISNDPLIASIGYYDFAYNILNDMIHRVFDISFADFRNEASIPYNELSIPICRKLAGIFLQNKNDKSLKCKLWVKESHDQPLRVVCETPVYPEFKVPQLVDLFDKTDNSDATEKMKWKLLFWTLSLEMNEESQSFIQTLPDKYFVFVLLTIVHLLKNKAINLLEADALLLAEFVSRNNNNSHETNHSDRINDAKNKEENSDEQNGSVEQNGSTQETARNDTVASTNTEISAVFPKKMNGRAIRVAHLYNGIRKMINVSLRSCGLKRLVEIPQFDGLYFHNAFEIFQQSQDIYERKSKDINQYRIYV